VGQAYIMINKEISPFILTASIVKWFIYTSLM